MPTLKYAIWKSKTSLAFTTIVTVLNFTNPPSSVLMWWLSGLMAGLFIAECVCHSFVHDFILEAK